MNLMCYCLKTYGFGCNEKKQLTNANRRGMGAVSMGEAAGATSYELGSSYRGWAWGMGFKKAYYGGNLKALHTEKDYIFTQTQLISCSYLKTIISNLPAPQKDENNHTAKSMLYPITYSYQNTNKTCHKYRMVSDPMTKTHFCFKVSNKFISITVQKVLPLESV